MKNIVLFGDSFLGRLGKKYISQFELLVPSAMVHNCAAGGLDTADGLARAGYIAGLKPDFVVLSFGANDAERGEISEEKFEHNLEGIVKAFVGSQVILLLCPPAYDPADPVGTKDFNDKIFRYNARARAVAERAGAKVVDSEKIFSPYLDRGENYHDEDGLHLNDLGYEVWIKALIDNFLW